MQLDRRQTGRERRQNLRIPAVFAVRNSHGRDILLGQAEDIGPTGMTLRWPKDADLDFRTAVTLTFELPGTQRPIAAAAQVVHDGRSGRFRRMGVRFTGLTPEHAALIDDYCHRA